MERKTEQVVKLEWLGSQHLFDWYLKHIVAELKLFQFSFGGTIQIDQLSQIEFKSETFQQNFPSYYLSFLFNFTTFCYF